MGQEDFMDEAKYKQSLLKSLPKIEQKLNYRNFSSDELIEVCKFLGMEYITGTRIISNLVKLILNSPCYLINLRYIISGNSKRLKFSHWIFDWNIKLNFFPFEFFKRQLLLS